MDVKGSVSKSIVETTVDYLATDLDYTIVFNATTDKTLTLPDAATCKGRIYVVRMKIVSNSGNKVDFATNGGSIYYRAYNSTPSNNSTHLGWVDADERYYSFTFQSDGVDWIVISDISVKK